MKTKVLITALICGAISQAGLAKPIEDGSSFTGQYVVQEQTCEKKEFSYETGQTILVPNFSFEGTPYGLKVDGSIIPIHENQIANHGSGFVTESAAHYVSSSEFIAQFAITQPAENQGQRTETDYDYALDEYGTTMIETTTVIIGNQAPMVTQICHYLRGSH